MADANKPQPQTSMLPVYWDRLGAFWLLFSRWNPLGPPKSGQVEGDDGDHGRAARPAVPI
jgi:hypothetical protein